MPRKGKHIEDDNDQYGGTGADDITTDSNGDAEKRYRGGVVKLI